MNAMPIDSAQLATLIEEHAGALRVWIGPRCAEADDVVQEAFCRLAIQQPPPDQPVAWLYRVCRNLAERQRLSDERRSKRERRWAERAIQAKPHDPVEVAETLAAVERLDKSLREVLVARIWGRLAWEEIGQLCGVSTTTAFRRYEAALLALRAALSPPCGKSS